MSKYLKNLKKMTRNCHKAIVSCHKKTLVFVTKKIKKILKWVDFKHWMLGIKRVLKHVKTLILLIAVFTVSLSANQIHDIWLEARVGNNTLFVRGINGAGSAFLVKATSGKTVLITNHHVCETANGLPFLQAFDKRNSQRFIPVRILESNEDVDLCILEGLPGYSGLELGTEVSVGDKVYAFGYPLAQAMNISEGRVKAPDVKISMLKHLGPCLNNKNETMFMLFLPICVASFNTISTDLAIYPGNSGGPMVNYFGNIVGVIFASDSRTHWGAAIQLADLKQLLSAY